MPVKGFKSITIKEDVYKELHELAEREGIRVTQLIENFVKHKKEEHEALIEQLKDFLKEELRKIVREELKDIAKDVIKEGMRELLKESKQNRQSKQGGGSKQNWLQIVKKAFLGERNPCSLKDGRIIVSKANIFLKERTDLDIDFSEFKATAFIEEDEEENPLGLSIVPNTGFTNSGPEGKKKLEEWFDTYGSKLLKALLKEVNSS